ncbi:MAG: amino acid ABC transporter substrate-binding protein [Acidimicrobiaceae bacterium]|nr:amino acid ABC transporter substrate-binding protein [Acidimicrobiaceae bacterium]MBT5851043.1 amino acid ABC transporter substrate-binding protein [Acidimicrobiaceae bacterium]
MTVLDRATQPRWLFALLVVGALTVSACSGGGVGDSRDASPDDESADDTTVAANETAADVIEVEVDEMDMVDESKYSLDHLDELTRWAAEFTNGPGIEATGDPILFGYVHDAELSPQHLPAARAAIDYINEHLGGVDGRPLELVSCDPSVPRVETAVDPETAAEIEVEISCEVGLAADDKLVVVVSQTSIGNTDLYDALADKKPVLVASPGSVAELTTLTTTSYLAGMLTTGGMGIWALSLELKSAVGLFTDNVAGRDGFTMLEPMFAAAGVELEPVWITSNTSASRLESALDGVGALDADLLILGLDEPDCVVAAGGLAALGINGTANIVISAGTCLRPGARAALAEVQEGFEIPANWHFATNGFNPFEQTVASGYATISAILGESLQPGHVGDTGVEAAVVAMLSITRALSRADGDFSYDAVNDSLRNPGAPVPTQAGDQHCGRSPAFTPVCAGRMGIIQYVDDTWTDVATGDAAIDLSQILFPPG